MIYKNIHKIKEDQFRNKSIVSIDFGTKRFGIAVSDITQKIATPYLNYERKNFSKDISTIKEILNEYNGNIILLGLPKDNNNKISQTAQRVKAFANDLNNNLSVNIFFWDERFSSKAAERVALSHEFKNIKDDKIAATFFLQAFLDFFNNS